MPLQRLVGASVSRLATIPLLARRTGRADFPHPALIRDHALRPRKARVEPSRRVRRGPPRSSGERTSPRPPPDGDDTASSAAARAFADRTAPPLSQPDRPRFPSLPHAAPSRVSGHSTEVLGSRHSPRPLPPSCALPNQGPFAPPALPGLSATTGPSATLPAQAGPRGFPVGACAPPAGLPVLLMPPSCTHAAVTTPTEATGARVARFPATGSLPRYSGGSASALPFSRPAQRSLTLRPARSLNRPRRPFGIGVLQSMSLPP